jgi:hypothetical protein
VNEWDTEPIFNRAAEWLLDNPSALIVAVAVFCGLVVWVLGN